MTTTGVSHWVRAGISIGTVVREDVLLGTVELSRIVPKLNTIVSLVRRTEGGVTVGCVGGTGAGDCAVAESVGSGQYLANSISTLAGVHSKGNDRAANLYRYVVITFGGDSMLELVLDVLLAAVVPPAGVLVCRGVLVAVSDNGVIAAIGWLLLEGEGGEELVALAMAEEAIVVVFGSLINVKFFCL